jgi:hypothetical protein
MQRYARSLDDQAGIGLPIAQRLVGRSCVRKLGDLERTRFSATQSSTQSGCRRGRARDHNRQVAGCEVCRRSGEQRNDDQLEREDQNRDCNRLKQGWGLCTP